jgi:hypothetical protein
MAKRKFPTLGFILLAWATVWLTSDLGYVKLDIPFLPIALIVVAIGMIYNRLVA